MGSREDLTRFSKDSRRKDNKYSLVSDDYVDSVKSVVDLGKTLKTCVGNKMGHSEGFKIVGQSWDGNGVKTAVEKSIMFGKLPADDDGNKAVEENDERKIFRGGSDEGLIFSDIGVNEKMSDLKRKRESVQEMLNWVRNVAKEPRDPAIGCIPESSKWKYYGNEELWKQVLLFREAVVQLEPGLRVGQLRQVPQSRYELRDRSRSRSNENKSVESSDSDIPTGIPYLDSYERFEVEIGPEFQADIPELTANASDFYDKWSGTHVWPLTEVRRVSLIERDPIGKGRQDSCGCVSPGSIDCVRFHIREKKAKVKLELGTAFEKWNFDKMGEDNINCWSDKEQTFFDDVMKSKPCLSPAFWKQMQKSLPSKTRENMISYYYNSFILRRRAYQNRNSPADINSDDEEPSETPNVYSGNEATQPSTSVLPAKKRKRRRSRTCS